MLPWTLVVEIVGLSNGNAVLLAVAPLATLLWGGVCRLLFGYTTLLSWGFWRLPCVGGSVGFFVECANQMAVGALVTAL